MRKRSGINEPLLIFKRDFYTRDVLEVAPALIGKILILKPAGSKESRFMITETEAYRGIEDKACHASKGRTARTEIMFHEGGIVYVYFVYGMYWMLNIVTGKENDPQAVLIRGVKGITGPGRVARELGIDGSFYGEDLFGTGRLKIADTGVKPSIVTQTRIGIDYAGEPWKIKLWRFKISE